MESFIDDMLFPALRMMKEGRSKIIVVHQTRIYEPGNMMYLKRCCWDVVDLFEKSWLCRHTVDKNLEIEAKYYWIWFMGWIWAVEFSRWSGTLVKLDGRVFSRKREGSLSY